MDKFVCDKCGLCCQNLNLNPIYAELDDGTGTCKYYDKETRLCKIYENRPLICNVEAGYQLYKDQLSYADYIRLNYDMCKRLKGE